MVNIYFPKSGEKHMEVSEYQFDLLQAAGLLVQRPFTPLVGQAVEIMRWECDKTRADVEAVIGKGMVSAPGEGDAEPGPAEPAKPSELDQLIEVLVSLKDAIRELSDNQAMANGMLIEILKRLPKTASTRLKAPWQP